MWQRAADFIKRTFLLQQKLESHDQSISSQQEELKRLAQAIMQLAYEMQRLREDFENLRREQGYERENLTLRLQVALLEAGRQLPPPGSANAGPPP